MRRIRYAVAASLDGYVAGPNGEADWIVIDPSFDFGEFFKEFDTVLVGRRTFEVMAAAGPGPMPGMETFVFSRTLRQDDHPHVTVVADRVEETVAELRNRPGKDIWLFGGGLLFRTLLDAGLVDTVEIALMPVLLGGGTPLLPPPAGRAKLRLVSQKPLGSGVVSLEYAVERR